MKRKWKHLLLTGCAVCLMAGCGGQAEAAASQPAATQAESQVRELLARADETAARHTDEVLEQARQACRGLQEKAEGRLEEAAAFIVRRVVNS